MLERMARFGWVSSLPLSTTYRALSFHRCLRGGREWQWGWRGGWRCVHHYAHRGVSHPSGETPAEAPGALPVAADRDLTGDSHSGEVHRNPAQRDRAAPRLSEQRCECVCMYLPSCIYFGVTYREKTYVCMYYCPISVSISISIGLEFTYHITVDITTARSFGASTCLCRKLFFLISLLRAPCFSLTMAS